MNNRIQLSYSALVVTTLVACGGGATNTATTPAATPPALTQPTSLALNLEDSFTAALTGTGDGLWSGGGSDSDGGGDAGGGAGDGEFVKLKMRFPNASNPTGTLTWTVLRSQYGITNTTGNLSIQKDTSSLGGYKVTATNGVASSRAGQGNFFVSSSGQVSGTLPLPIGAGGAIKDTLFNGVRFKDTPSTAKDMSDIAGTYSWGGIFTLIGSKPLVTLGNDKNVNIGSGHILLNADGSGRWCSGSTTYSSTCAGGINFQATFDDPNSRNMVRFKDTGVQSGIAADKVDGFDMLVVFRKFGTSSVAFTADVLGTKGSASALTGALYAARAAATPSSPAAAIGSFNYTYRSITGSGAGTAQVAIANVGGVIKGRPGLGTSCNNGSFTLTAGPVNGVLTSTTASNPNPGYIIQLDTDFSVFVSNGDEIGFARRYSTDPTKAPCQPS